MPDAEWYASIFAKKYGLLVRYAFFAMVRVMGMVHWYGILQKFN